MRWISIIAVATAVAIMPMASTTSWAATFTVSKVTDADAGTCDADCSLREAIDATHTNAGPHVIEFTIPGAGVQTLTLRIELDGSALGGFEDGFRFVDGSEVRGLAITNLLSSNVSTGITIFGSDLVVEGHCIGVDATGNAALGNSRGSLVTDAAGAVQIGGTGSGARNLVTSKVMRTLDSLPNVNYLVEIFANSTCDPSGHGEAETSLGQLQLTTDAQGIAVIDATFPVDLIAGQSVTATATNSINQSSEISMCLAAEARTVVEVPALGSWGLALLASSLCWVGVSTSRRQPPPRVPRSAENPRLVKIALSGQG